MAKSQNGYPAPPPRVRDFKITEHTSIPLRDGATGLILCHAFRRIDWAVEDIDYNYKKGELDDWGVAYRMIRGYEDDLSNHASGTAGDINATEHPLGVKGSWAPKEVARINHILKMYDGCIRWGENYNNRKDGMHFEIDRNLETCERVAKELFDTRNGKWLLKNNPGLKAYVLS